MNIDPSKNTVICGDNLEWLKYIPDNSVDVCYIDPPFFSNATYKKVWGNGLEVASFADKFSGGISEYIEWMRPRIKLIKTKLKDTGSIFLHCDHHANHRLRVLLDEEFGESNFVNEIIWHYRRWSNVSSSFQKMHDTILFYAKKNKNHKFNILKQPYAVPEAIEDTVRVKVGGKLVRAKDADGEYIKRGKVNDGVPMHDVWEDINFIAPTSSERMGYRTQKPEALIQRIIECSSEPGDVILDCFAGGFTTAKVAQSMNRKFICGDVSPVACKLGMKRLNASRFYDYESKGLYQTEEDFRNMDVYKFPEAVCEVMGWDRNPKNLNSKGIDGLDGNGNPVQIKNCNGLTGDTDITNFFNVLCTSNAKTGIFVAWGFSPETREFVARCRDEVVIELRECRELIKDLFISNEKRAHSNVNLYEEIL